MHLQNIAFTKQWKYFSISIFNRVLFFTVARQNKFFFFSFLFLMRYIHCTGKYCISHASHGYWRFLCPSDSYLLKIYMNLSTEVVNSHCTVHTENIKGKIVWPAKTRYKNWRDNFSNSQNNHWVKWYHKNWRESLTNVWIHWSTISIYCSLWPYLDYIFRIVSSIQTTHNIHSSHAHTVQQPQRNSICCATADAVAFKNVCRLLCTFLDKSNRFKEKPKTSRKYI